MVGLQTMIQTRVSFSHMRTRLTFSPSALRRADKAVIGFDVVASRMTSQLSQHTFQAFLFPSHKYLPIQSLAFKVVFSCSIALVSAKVRWWFTATQVPFIHTCAGDANSLFSLYAFFFINWGFIFDIIAQELTLIPTFMTMNNDAFGPYTGDCVVLL